jgi:RNA polymerase sigma-70 factor (ECF subfamily)
MASVLPDQRGCRVGPERVELLVRLLSKHQADLFRYIFALMPNEEDARDVLQETSVALYRKFGDYDSGKPFLAWAFGFAHMEVLKQRDRNQRGTRYLGREVIERLAQERARHEPVLEDRLRCLEDCLKELPPEDGELIRRRYQGGFRSEELMKQLGTSRRTLFRNLDRIRRVLFECVSRRLAALD